MITKYDLNSVFIIIITTTRVDKREKRVAI